ncbi:hypothetical protein N7G274_010198 [Stereocaulon virgatum]|uniref:Uncharacterized protein n=1 Tax=Stereocaulon virgatum TaxID=373712 RepID=A0ABR3ZWL6_9LECA
MASDILFSSFWKAAIPLPSSQWDSSSPVSTHQTSPSLRTDLSKGKQNVLHPTSKTSNLQPTTHPFAEDCDSCSTFFSAPCLVEDSGSEKSTETPGLYELDLEEFDLAGFTADEIKAYNSMAEPGQRLQDAMTPRKVTSSIPKPAKYSNQDQKTLPIPRQINLFVRKHSFLEKSLSIFTKSERRQFERNVYDFGRSLGLRKPEARKYVVKAREFCGEEEYDSDVSALEGEIDDSATTIDRLPRTIEPEAILPPASQGRPNSQTESRSGDKRRVGEDSTIARTPLPSKKRKASTMGEGRHTAPQSELVRINAELAKHKDSAQKSAQNLPIEASEANLKESPTEAVAKGKEERKARKAAKKARKAEERMRRRAQASPMDNESSFHRQHENDTKVFIDYLDYLEEWREFDEELKNDKEGKAHKTFKEALVEIQNSAEDHQQRKKRRRSSNRFGDATEEPKSTISKKERKQQADFRLPMIQSA